VRNPWQRVLFAVEEWLRSLRSIFQNFTLYVASYGTIGGVKNEAEKEKWKENLGVRRYFPDARTVHVDCGHVGILADEVVIIDLQRGYI
jgi:hypothetical protein